MNRSIFTYFTLSLLFPHISVVRGDSCCGDSTCEDSCPWNGACNNGRDYSCMDRISGPFKCRDKSVCKDYYACSDEDAALRTGQLCNSFPWFNGGYPFDPIKTDSELKTYNCTKAANNKRYCKEWNSLEDNLDEFETGHVTCLQESSNGNYCQEWTALGKEYKKCWSELVYTSDGAAYNYYCCDKSTQNLACCQNLCPISFYNNPQIQYERSQCSCKKASSNGKYCFQWYCEEQTVFSMSDSTSDQPIEYEWYTCKTNNLGDSYCPSWDGDIDSVEEFEVATCTCQNAQGSEYCQDWSCLEKGYDYWWPNMLWNLLSGIIGSLPLFALLVELQLIYKVYFWIPYALWAGGFIMIGVWKAGIGVAIISGGYLYVLPLLAIGIYKWYQVLSRSEKEGRPGYGTVKAEAEVEETYDRDPPMAPAVRCEEIELGHAMAL